MKADACLQCKALLIRADDTPAPAVCTRCGGALVRPPTPRLADLVALARSGEDAEWAYRRVLRDAVAAEEEGG